MKPTRYWWQTNTPHQPPENPNHPMPPTRLTASMWPDICSRIGGCVSSPQLDPTTCVYCQEKVNPS